MVQNAHSVVATWWFLELQYGSIKSNFKSD